MIRSCDPSLAAIGFRQLHHKTGWTMAVIAARGGFRLSEDGALAVADEQELVLSDVYEGPPHTTAFVRVGDLIPYKPATDVTLVGDAHAPGGRAAPHWFVGVRVGALEHVLRVFGPRRWRAGEQGWTLGEAQPVDSFRLDDRHASGGDVIGHPDRSNDPRNPRGPGLIDAEHTPRGRDYDAPRVDSAAHRIEDPFARPEPQGLGPVAPWRRFRQQYAGTYDEAWRARDPLLPEDFDYRFYQCAHPSLIAPGYLAGDEEVSLAGLTPGGGALRFRLPCVQPVARFAWSDAREASARLNLVGLHLDLRGAPPWRVELTWRVWIEACPRFLDAAVEVLPLAQTLALPRGGAHGLEEAS